MCPIYIYNDNTIMMPFSVTKSFAIYTLATTSSHVAVTNTKQRNFLGFLCFFTEQTDEMSVVDDSNKINHQITVVQPEFTAAWLSASEWLLR